MNSCKSSKKFEVFTLELTYKKAHFLVSFFYVNNELIILIIRQVY